VAVDAAPEWRLCRVGSVYRSVLSQAGTPIKEATMREIVAGSAISPGDVADSPRIGGSATGTADRKGAHA
jgi:hypothetical protein